MNKESFKRQVRIIRRKKWPIPLAVILIISIIVSPIAYNEIKLHKRLSPKNPVMLSTEFKLTKEREKIHMIAHRGYSAQAPENTVPAIQKAAEYGFDTVEIDVRQTQDGVWVISHDADVKTLTDKSGKISSYTYYDLVTCTVDKGAHHEEYEKLKIPTLEQALKACLENNVVPMIEIKDYTEDGINTLLETIDRYGFTDTCSVISFDRKPLELVYKENRSIKLYALVQKLNDSEMKKCLQNPSIGVSFNAHQSANDEKKIKELLENNVSLACWTVDDTETMRKYFDMGVTDFVSNVIYPK